MDPVGTAASVLAFAGCAVKFFQAAKAFYDGQSELESEQLALERYMIQLARYAEKLPDTTGCQPDHQDMISDCREIAAKLLRHLGRLNGKRKKSVTSSLRAAVMTIWTKDEMNQTMTRLNTYTLRLIAIENSEISKHTSSTLENTKYITQDTSTILKTTAKMQITTTEMHTAVHDLQQDFRASQIEMRTQSTEHHVVLKQQSIITSLESGLADQRYMDIADAAKVTYEWIFEDDLLSTAADDNEDAKGPERPSFGLKEWLESGDGLFHIVGKPGSGKSTLMKFICEHPDTPKKLAIWAGPDKELVVSHFFFWKHGNIHQRKLNGLRRTLLASVLSQMPNEIPSVFPDLWERLDSPIFRGRLGLGLQDTIKITDRQIRDAFNTMIKQAGSVQDTGHRFCFFIDGLDELDDDPDFGYGDLAELLLEWVNDSRGRIKMCVSSRELPVLLDRLSSAQRVQLRDFTKHDIKALVHYTLNKDAHFHRLAKEHPKDCQKFLNSVAWCSDGVFLWIRFILPTITRALENRAKFSKLCQLLEKTPKEVQDFFKSIILSIRDEDRMEAYSVFALLLFQARISKFGIGHDFGLLQYSFLSDILQDPDYAKNYPVRDELDLVAMEQSLDDASVRLRGYCNGLVELRPNSELYGELIYPHLAEDLPGLHTHLNFIHRDIPEFLWDSIYNDEEVPDYLSDRNIFGLALDMLILRVKAVPFLTIEPLQLDKDFTCPVAVKTPALEFLQALSSDIYHVIEMLHKLSPEEQNSAYPLLDLLDEAICRQQRWLPDGCNNSLDIDWTRYCPLHAFDNGRRTIGRLPVISLLHVAIAFGPTGYVWWKIEQRPGWLDHPPNKLEVLDSVMENIHFGDIYQGVPVLKELLDRGALAVEESPWTNCPSPRINFTSNFTRLIWKVLRTDPAGGPYFEENHRIWDVLEVFLRHKGIIAKKRLYIFSAHEAVDPCSGHNVDACDNFWHYEHAMVGQDNDTYYIRLEQGHEAFSMRNISWDVARFLAEREDNTCFFRDIVAFLQPYNMSVLLDLFDSVGGQEEDKKEEDKKEENEKGEEKGDDNEEEEDENKEKGEGEQEQENMEEWENIMN